MNYFNPDPKSEKKPKKPYAGIKRSSIKKKFPKPTGEKALNDKIYVERGGVCGITGLPVPNKPINFLHVLSKGAFPKFRLKRYNVLLVVERIHDLYDNSSKEKLLAEFPKAIRIYQLKEILKEAYHQPHFDREPDTFT